MKSDLIQVLKHLALLGGVHDYIIISSAELGEILNISQQSASRKILQCLDEQLITRRLGARRQQIKLTPKGLEILRREHSDYLRLFETLEHLTIRGVVTSGLGEGQYYVMQKEYLEQFRKKLWFEPYKGTLNLKLAGGELSKLNVLKESEGILIEGFEGRNRTFGRCKCFLAEIQDVECAVVLPRRTHYTDIIEIISKECLRKKLGLMDGDVVEVMINL